MKIDVDDLVILVRGEGDGAFYRFSRGEFEERQRMPTSMLFQVALLVEQGTVLADIPLGSIPGCGAMCFLVNLSGLSRPNRGGSRLAPPETETRPASGEDRSDNPCLRHPAPAIDDLVVRDKSSKDFYWIKKCQYQNDEHRVKACLARELRVLTDQGVLLAHIPAKSLRWVEDDFCLVNLRDILRPEIKLKEERKQREK